MTVAGPWLLVNSFRAEELEGLLGNLTAANAVSIVLLTQASNIGASSTVFSGVTGEVANGNGYATGGIQATFAEAGTTNATLTFTENIEWTASGDGIEAYYAAVKVNTGGYVLAYCLLNSAPAVVSVAAGDTLTIGNGTPVLTEQ